MEFQEKLNKIKQSIGPLFSKKQQFLSQPKNVVSPKIAAVMNSSSSSFGSKLIINYANPNISENLNSTQYSTNKLNDTSLGHLKNPSKSEYQRYKQILFNKPTTNNNSNSNTIQRSTSPPLAGEIIAKRTKRQSNTEIDFKQQQHPLQGQSYLLSGVPESTLSKNVINSKKNQNSQQYPSNYSSIHRQSNQEVTDISMIPLSSNIKNNQLTYTSDIINRTNNNNISDARDIDNDSVEMISAALEQEFSCLLGSSAEGKQFAEWVNNLGVQEDLQESEAAIRSLKEQQRVLQGERERLAEEIEKLNEIQFKKGRNNRNYSQTNILGNRTRNRTTVIPGTQGQITNSEYNDFEEMWKQLEDKDKDNLEEERQNYKKNQQKIIVDDDEWLDGILIDGDNNNNIYDLLSQEEQEQIMKQQYQQTNSNQIEIENSNNSNTQIIQNMLEQQQQLVLSEEKSIERSIRTPREIIKNDSSIKQSSSNNSTQFIKQNDKLESQITINNTQQQLKSNTNNNILSQGSSQSFLGQQQQQNSKGFEQQIQPKQNRVLQQQETTKGDTQYFQPNYSYKSSNKNDNYYQIQKDRNIDRYAQNSEEQVDYHNNWQDNSADELKQQKYEQQKQDSKQQQNQSQQLPTINKQLIDNLAEEVEMLMRMQNLKHEKVDELELGYQQTFAELEASKDKGSWMKSQQQNELYEIQEEEDHSIDEEQHSIVQQIYNYHEDDQ